MKRRLLIYLGLILICIVATFSLEPTLRDWLFARLSKKTVADRVAQYEFDVY
jgi:hypothetical protein